MPAFTVHQSLLGGSLVGQVEAKIVLLAGRVNSTTLGLSIVHTATLNSSVKAAAVGNDRT